MACLDSPEELEGWLGVWQRLASEAVAWSSFDGRAVTGRRQSGPAVIHASLCHACLDVEHETPPMATLVSVTSDGHASTMSVERRCVESG